MTDSAAAFFTALGERGHEPLLQRASGTLRFDLAHGKEVDRWFLTIARGNVAVSRKNAKADCVVRAQRALFEEMAEGRVNAMAALLRGALTWEGDVELLVLFQRVLPGPPGASGRVAAIPAGRRV